MEFEKTVELHSEATLDLLAQAAGLGVRVLVA